MVEQKEMRFAVHGDDQEDAIKRAYEAFCERFPTSVLDTPHLWQFTSNVQVVKLFVATESDGDEREFRACFQAKLESLGLTVLDYEKDVAGLISEWSERVDNAFRSFRAEQISEVDVETAIEMLEREANPPVWVYSLLARSDSGRAQEVLIALERGDSPRALEARKALASAGSGPGLGALLRLFDEGATEIAVDLAKSEAIEIHTEQAQRDIYRCLMTTAIEGNAAARRAVYDQFTDKKVDVLRDQIDGDESTPLWVYEVLATGESHLAREALLSWEKTSGRRARNARIELASRRDREAVPFQIRLLRDGEIGLAAEIVRDTPIHSADRKQREQLFNLLVEATLKDSVAAAEALNKHFRRHSRLIRRAAKEGKIREETWVAAGKPDTMLRSVRRAYDRNRPRARGPQEVNTSNFSVEHQSSATGSKPLRRNYSFLADIVVYGAGRDPERTTNFEKLNAAVREFVEIYGSSILVEPPLAEMITDHSQSLFLTFPAKDLDHARRAQSVLCECLANVGLFGEGRGRASRRQSKKDTSAVAAAQIRQTGVPAASGAWRRMFARPIRHMYFGLEERLPDSDLRSHAFSGIDMPVGTNRIIQLVREHFGDKTADDRSNFEDSPGFGEIALIGQNIFEEGGINAVLVAELCVRKSAPNSGRVVQRAWNQINSEWLAS